MRAALVLTTTYSSGSAAPGWLKACAVVAGVTVAAAVLVSALETVVLPRNSFTRLTRVTFAVIDRVLIHPRRTGARADNLRALYGPVALVSLPMVWMLSVIVGFTLIFWGVDSGSLSHSFDISGSSVTTLGFAAPVGSVRTWITFVEAIIGLGLVALLISYLPTIYAAHHDREKGIATVRPFTGTPPSGVNLLVTLHSFDALDNPDLWESATQWLLELGQTHCAFPALCYFPETSGVNSWVASVGALLDTGALLLSGTSVDLAGDTNRSHQGPMLVLAHGVPTLVEIGRAAGLPIDPPIPLVRLIPTDGSRTPPEISVTRAEYEAALDRLGEIVPVAPEDRDSAWHRFAWVRSAYDPAVRGLAGLTQAVPAPWTTDRPARVGRPRLVTNRPLAVDWSLPDGP